MDQGLDTLRWLPEGQLPLDPSDPVRAWILERGSLTRKLQSEREGAFHLELLLQRAEPLPDAIAPLVDAEPGGPGHRRDVRLYAGDQACIYARSYWPELTERDQEWLDGLGERPLGDALFTHPQASRGPIEVARVEAPAAFDGMLSDGSEQGGPIWGRRSVFRIAGTAPLLVHEFFLPGLAASGVTV